MRNKLATALIAATTAGVFATAAMAAGPRPSSENYVPNQPAGVPVTSYDAAMMGPRPSSENHVAAPPMVQAADAAPHYAWQQGYDPHGKWHGHWVLVR